ncbi:aldose 1-epimerase family protein [Candidatus Aerophobetes bacterium]|nr:aldose 1-epimerase family protein [Candidatus Aerophobetes bacterium]
MASIYGTSYTKGELRRLVGDISQIAGTKKYQLIDGKGRGTRQVDVWTGSGFCFTISLDRGMDISQASYCGRSLCWRSSTGDVHPHFFEPRGFGWLRSFFGGLLTTCGLTYCGAPCVDEGEELGLHGRISNIPAEKVKVEERWEKDEYLISVEGLMRETRVFGENLILRRRISTRLGESRLWIHDVVTNEGFEETPLMILYHINAGFPVVEDGSRLISPTIKVKPRDKEAEEGKEDYYKFSAPIPGFKEKVYYHQMREDSSGQVHCALINEAKGIGLYLIYRKEELPQFIEWKMMGEGTYVVGMEPANCLVEGRDKDRQRGTLQFIKPGTSREFNLEIGVLDGGQQIEKFEKTILEEKNTSK